MRPATLAILTLWTMLSGPVLQSPGQWGARCAGPVRVERRPAEAEQVEINGQPAGTWRYGQGGYIYRRDKQGNMLGAYDPDRNLWFPLLGGEYDEADAIEYQLDRDHDKSNKGLDAGWVRHLKESHPDEISIGGKMVDLATAQQMIGTNVPPYSKQASFTVVTRDEALRDRIVKDFLSAPELAEYKGRAIVRAYAPDHWHLAPFSIADNPDFQASGYALLIQGPPDADGKATPKMMNSYPGPAKLAAVLATLRKPGPDYDPRKIDKVPVAVPVVGGMSWATLAAIAALVVSVYLLTRKKKP